MSQKQTVVQGFVLPGLPHLLLAAEANPGWKKVRQAMERVREQIAATDIDVLLIYSSYWPSVIGHQIQARPAPESVHVDEEFHALGSIPYKLKVDTDLAHAYVEAAKARHLHARAIDYQGFPIDTGSLVVSKLINPNNRLPCVIVSSNIYADQAETALLGQAAREALEKQGKKAVAVIVTPLSDRLHERHIEPKEDAFHALTDQGWNQKMLQILGAGRLEEAITLAQTNKAANFKPFWWLSAVMGPNSLAGEVLEYQPVYGSGAAVLGLTPGVRTTRDLGRGPATLGGLEVIEHG